MELMRRGQKSQAVADLQRRLDALGFHIPAGELGGSFGPGTEAAVKSLQQQRGLVADGIAGEETWRVVVESSWSLGDRLLHLADPYLRGDDVRELQESLNALGFNAGKHDGIFGPRTAEALRAFQKELAIEEDQIAGRETLVALDRLRLVTKHGLGPRISEREARKAAPPGISGKRIAIDPGHGGGDRGESSPAGHSEADLSFHLAAVVARLLDAQGAETLLTRGPLDGPTESQRAALANRSGADILISLHLNAHPAAEAAGTATYYFQHGPVASEPGEHLANLIQDSLVTEGLVDCRSHGKGYPLLRETTMPAVLVEPLFITNPAEAKIASDPDSIEKIAGAIVRAISGYFSAA